MWAPFRFSTANISKQSSLKRIAGSLARKYRATGTERVYRELGALFNSINT